MAKKRRGVEVGCVLALISNCNNYMKFRLVMPSQPPSKSIASHTCNMKSLFASMICKLENGCFTSYTYASTPIHHLSITEIKTPVLISRLCQQNEHG